MSEGYTVGTGMTGSGRYQQYAADEYYDDDVRAWGWWLWLLFGLIAGVLGLLPWLLTGMTLPLQNLWSSDVAPSDMPSALLPLSQYQLGTIAALIVVGSALAGILARSAHRRLSGGGFWALTGGVVLVQFVAIAQSALVVGAGLGDEIASVAYLAVLVLFALVSVLIGVGILALIARAPRAGSLIGIALAASPFAQWATGFVRLATPTQLSPLVAEVVVWIPALIIAAAIIWCGVNTFGRVIAAILAQLVLWVSSPLSSAAAAAAGTRVLARSPYEMVDYGVRVFRTTVLQPYVVLLPLAAAIVLAAIGLVVRGLVGAARRRRAPQQFSRTDSAVPFDDRGAFVSGAMAPQATTGAIDTVPQHPAAERYESPTEPYDL
jgi:hypothetical protein